jgi:hypothetical protein
MFSELQKVTSLGRGEIRECINRGIISAPAGVGQGHHRAYSKWNLVEGVIAAALLRQVRAGTVELIINNLRKAIIYRHGDLEAFCEAPIKVSDISIFGPRMEPDDEVVLPLLGDEMAGKGGRDIIGIRTTKPEVIWGNNTDDNPLFFFTSLRVDLGQAVRFVDHMIDTRL